MKKILTFAIVCLLGCSAFAQEALPTTAIKDFKGKSVAFNEAITPGKVTLISFWANWCVPCKKEIKAIRDNLKDWQGEIDFDYVTISIDDSRSIAKARSYAKSQGWDFPSYLDPNSDLKRAMNFQNIPYTIIIDKEGKVAYRHSGFSEGGEFELFEKIKELDAAQ